MSQPISSFTWRLYTASSNRRYCPVCKAECTVDSVIPIYIHVPSSPTGAAGSVSSDVFSMNTNQSSMESLESLCRPEGGDSSHVGETVSTPRGSPTGASGLFAAVNTEDDPTTVNLGLRRRRASTTSTATTQQQTRKRQDNDQQPMVGTPIRQHTDLVEDFDNCHQSTTRNNNSNPNNTPVHRNGSGSGGSYRSSNDMQLFCSGNSHVPSRPAPMSPLTSSNVLSTATAETSHRGQHDHQPESPPLNTAIGTSSPFRMALRPRRQPFALSSPPRHQGYATSQQYQQMQTYAHRHNGRLTSVLMGFVNTIDNLAIQSGGSSRQQGNQPLAASIPQLHRSDGGLGGIGRSSEHTQQGGQANSVHVNGMSEEESSLAMAREFLSRLLLMLACFVILCLLLF